MDGHRVQAYYGGVETQLGILQCPVEVEGVVLAIYEAKRVAHYLPWAVRNLR